MLIGICDDDERDRKQIVQICESVLERSTEKYEIREFETGRSVLEYQHKIEILILDIEMPEVDGIQIKQQLQRVGYETIIIFVSGHREMSRELIGVHVFDFITKDFLQSQLPLVLETAIDMIDDFTYIDGVIDSRRVLFLKTEHVYARIFCTNNKEYLVRKSMKALEEQLLPLGYLRVHREYLVNMKWIDTMSKNKLSICGVTIPISVRMSTRAEKIYREYRKKKAGFC